MSKIILLNKNGTEIEIEAGENSTLFDIVVSPEQYVTMWNGLTDNLKMIKIVSGGGIVMDQRNDLIADHELSTLENGEVVSHFHMREKTEVELLREQVADLTAQLSVHDGAINDLGEVVGSLADEEQIRNNTEGELA